MNKKMLKKPKRVLCYVDMSKDSSYAVKYAFELCKLLDAELFVMHSVADIKAAAGLYVPHMNMEMLEQEVIQGARDKLYGICRHAAGDSIDTAHRLVTSGAPMEDVEMVIKEKQIELIVIPHDPSKGTLSWLRGAYAEKFMRNATIPFLVLPMV